MSFFTVLSDFMPAVFAAGGLFHASWLILALTRARFRFDRPWRWQFSVGWYIVIETTAQASKRFCARFHRGDAPLPLLMDGS